MNRKLLDPFEPEYPEAIEACLDDEYATKCAFSHHGSLLATARSDGKCYIWDMDALNVVRKLNHSEVSLTGVSWSRNSRYILTVDEMGLCILWDLQDGSVHAKVEFGSAINCARVHPRNASQFIVCPSREAPCIVTVGEGSPTVAPIRIVAETADLKTKAAASTCCCFGKKGVFAFFGTSKGQVHAVHVSTLTVACSVKLSSSAVNTIAQNPRGSEIVTNSTDRILRVCQVSLPANPQKPTPDDGVPSIAVVTKIQDIVNRVHWIQAVFSSSGDYIVSGIEHKAEHNIYIWDKFTGSLVKMLTGPNELLEDCAVHPLRPVYASVSTFGIIYLWTRVPQQNWNAFAPGFRELEENIDYMEPEDEFDRTVTTKDGTVVDCGEERTLREKRMAGSKIVDDSELIVDVTDNDPFFSDSDSELEDEGFVLPVDVACDASALPPPTTDSLVSVLTEDKEPQEGHAIEES
ncbi:WD40 repeat-like protein [Martensiomyces pterosporus]|nr:WD40 repeat-like protein [Martensiomyces pterosporus]